MHFRLNFNAWNSNKTAKNNVNVIHTYFKSNDINKIIGHETFYHLIN